MIIIVIIDSLNLSASVIHYEEALDQVYAPLPLPLNKMVSYRK